MVCPEFVKHNCSSWMHFGMSELNYKVHKDEYYYYLKTHCNPKLVVFQPYNTLMLY